MESNVIQTPFLFLFFGIARVGAGKKIITFEERMELDRESEN